MPKHRIFPMQICNADLDTWLTHPIVVTKRLIQVLLNKNPAWKCTKIRVYPRLNGLSFEGKPFMCGLPLPVLHNPNLVLALVEVPDDEPEKLFVTLSESGLALER